MKTVQKKVDLTVEQLAAIIKKLSPADRDRLDALMWEGYEIPDEHYKVVMERVEKARKDPSRLIPWETAKDMLTKKG